MVNGIVQVAGINTGRDIGHLPAVAVHGFRVIGYKPAMAGTGKKDTGDKQTRGKQTIRLLGNMGNLFYCKHIPLHQVDNAGGKKNTDGIAWNIAPYKTLPKHKPANGTATQFVCKRCAYKLGKFIKCAEYKAQYAKLYK